MMYMLFILAVVGIDIGFRVSKLVKDVKNIKRGVKNVQQ